MAVIAKCPIGSLHNANRDIATSTGWDASTLQVMHASSISSAGRGFPYQIAAIPLAQEQNIKTRPDGYRG